MRNNVERGFVKKMSGKSKMNRVTRQKTRKTFNTLDRVGNKTTKRKKTEDLQTVNSKHKKNEEFSQIESSSPSDSEPEDDLIRLLNTFSKKETALAIDSEDENSVVDEPALSEEYYDVDSLDDVLSENGILQNRIKMGDIAEESNDNFSENESESDNKDNFAKTNINIDSHNGDDIEPNQDPFVRHLFYDIHENLLASVQSNPITVNKYVESWPQLGKLCIQIPKYDKTNCDRKDEFGICEPKIYAAPGEIPNKLNGKSLEAKDVYIKTQVNHNLSKVNGNETKLLKDIFTPFQGEIFSVLNNYQDFYYPNRTFSNAEEIRFVYCLHAVNHILKTRAKIIHHNARLGKKDEIPEEFRDQGLVRPKVLIIVPFKDAAYKIINLMTDLILSENKGNVINQKRFIDDYTGNELTVPRNNPKPEDYHQIFQGNISDDFKIGVTITKKSIKVYADFYSSDLIVASPLGLRRIIGAEGEPDRDYDFLASIELLIFDQAEVFLMQNWDHITHILNHMHLQPKESHGTDFSRVRIWSLNGWTKYYRQTLIFSSVAIPEINSVFNKKCLNYAGKVKVANMMDVGCISQVFVQLPHVFHKFDVQNISDNIDGRFEYFITKILPQQKENLMNQTLIFIPNYFDYVKVRNYFKREDFQFVQICEYSKEGKTARARDMFYHGDAHFLLYTERYHFYNRKRIKGIRHIIFYQLPNFPHFYYEMCNLMQEANMNKKIGNMSNMTVSVIYSKYDIHQLSAVVGTDRAAKMSYSDKKIHMMVTGVN